LRVGTDGQVVLKLKTAWRDGTRHRVMEPMEFMQRLAALVPRPRLHLIRFHGVLAPNAKPRKAVVPVPPTATVPAHASDCAHLPVGSAKGRMCWAQLLKRVFDIDIERCPHCGGQLKLIAAIEDAAAIARLLTHLGLAAQPPPRAPARRVDLFQAASPVKPDWTLTGLGEVCGRRSGKRSDGVEFRRAACGNCRRGCVSHGFLEIARARLTAQRSTIIGYIQDS